MKSSLIWFCFICSFVLLVTVIPEGEGVHVLKELFDQLEDRGLKRRVIKKLTYYFLLTGNKKIYAIPFPLPLPIPILKKLQPIIYKENIPVPVPVHYPQQQHHQPMSMESYGSPDYGNYGGY